jgi:DNA-binding PadR family transcriptional regulator
MSLPHAILGFLDALPMSGYDLKTQAFDRSVAHFWPAVLPQIYRELEALEAHGWVTHTVQMQLGRPNRKVHTITPDGRAELERWLRTHQPPPAHREAFLIQLFFAAGLPNSAIRTLLEAQRAAHAQRFGALQQIVIPPPENPAAGRRQALTGMTLDLGLRLEQTYLSWIDACLTALNTLEEPLAPPPDPTERGADS